MLAFVDLISLHVFHLLPKTEGHAAVHAGGSVRGVQPEGPHHAVLYSPDWSYLGEALLHPISQFRQHLFFFFFFFFLSRTQTSDLYINKRRVLIRNLIHIVSLVGDKLITDFIMFSY